MKRLEFRKRVCGESPPRSWTDTANADWVGGSIMATKAQLAKAVDSQLVAATAAGKSRLVRGDIATSVVYEPKLKRLHVELASGVAVSVPVSKVQGLAGTAPALVKSVSLAGKGSTIRWAQLDLDVSVTDLVAGCFGTRAWMTTLARQGGRATSDAKAAAARSNGKKGGRPRKAPTQELPAGASA
ncbi:MAG: DUF2442 domain-containing protein [Betaproteobacteria bacterium]